MAVMIEQTIATTTHGRYLIEPATGDGPAPLVAGFHGYAESADVHMERLRAIPGGDRWTRLSIQGLNRFYERRTDAVIAGWMTRQDRELAIADNCAYVSGVIDAEWAARLGSRGVVFAGFSQGVAMAFRAAAASSRPVLGVIAVGGDVPPELDRSALARLNAVLLVRGARDSWYTASKFTEDRRRLADAVVEVTAVEFDGAHEWADAVSAVAAAFLDARFERST
jgi:predicted esterase